MFNLFQEDSIMAEFDRIATEPIDNEPYSLVQNPKPVVESVLDFNGTKVDTGKWCEGSGVCEDKKKVGKAKTAPNPKLTKESAKTKSGEKKDDGKIVENVDAAEKKDDGKVTEVKTATKVEESKTAPKATEAKGFDAAAKSAKTSQEGEAKSNKKFAKGCDIQTRIKLFKEGVKALGIDDKTKKDADKVLKEFDKISKMFVKAKMESVTSGTMTNENAADHSAEIIDGVYCVTDKVDPATFDARSIPEEYRNSGNGILFGSVEECKKVIQTARIIGLAYDCVITAGEALSQISQVTGGSVIECAEGKKN